MCINEWMKFLQAEPVPEKKIMEKLADILAEEKMITALEQIRLKDKLKNYRGTL